MIDVIDDKCDFCGTCVAVCPVDSIELYEARIVITQSCIDCMLCVWICPVETLAQVSTNGHGVSERNASSTTGAITEVSCATATIA